MNVPKNDNSSILFRDISLKAPIYKNAKVLPSKGMKNGFAGGVISSEGKFIISSAWHEGYSKGYEIDDNNIAYRDEKVIYIGCLYHIWGHAITDNLKKIWYLRQSHPSYKYIYITANNEILPNYVFEIFKLLNIDLNIAEQIKDPISFKEIIIPDNAIVNVNEKRFYSKEFKTVIDDIRNQIEPMQVGKIYLTRSHIINSRDVGERCIERLFEKRGYRIVAPEELSLNEQLKILGNCTSFVATEGSISHSSIFCKPKTEVIILRKIDYINPYTCFINQMCDLNVKYIDVHHSSLASKERPWLGPFYLYITKDLSRFMGYYGLHLPYYLYPSWYEYKYKLWSSIRNFYYNLRALFGIRTRIKKIIYESIYNHPNA